MATETNQVKQETRANSSETDCSIVRTEERELGTVIRLNNRCSFSPTHKSLVLKIVKQQWLHSADRTQQPPHVSANEVMYSKVVDLATTIP
jgi:hypothetical protein